MAKPPKIPADQVVERIRKQVTQGDRSPFHGVLADALSVAPSKTAWRQLARQNPERWVNAVQTMAKMSGYADRHESVQVRHDASSIVGELVNRFGVDQARSILSDFGLPASLIPAEAQSEAIDGEIVPNPDESTGEAQNTTGNDTGIDTA